jgi:hypothetical protein
MDIRGIDWDSRRGIRGHLGGKRRIDVKDPQKGVAEGSTFIPIGATRWHRNRFPGMFHMASSGAQGKICSRNDWNPQEKGIHGRTIFIRLNQERPKHLPLCFHWSLPGRPDGDPWHHPGSSTKLTIIKNQILDIPTYCRD